MRANDNLNLSMLEAKVSEVASPHDSYLVFMLCVISSYEYNLILSQRLKGTPVQFYGVFYVFL